MNLLELVKKLKETNSLVNTTLSEKLVNKYCNDSKIIFEDHVDRSHALETHLPKFEEVYQMTVIPTLWSDLFSIECDIIAKLMSNHVNKLGIDPNYSNFIQLLSHLNSKIHNTTQGIKLSQFLCIPLHTYIYLYIPLYTSIYYYVPLYITMYLYILLCTSIYYYVPLYITMYLYILLYMEEKYASGILSNLTVYNDRLNVKVNEDRVYYENCCVELLYLSEKQLLDRPAFIEKWRFKVLKFLKDLSLTFNIDKCTHNLSILFFDYYIHLCTQNYINTPSSVNTLDDSNSHLSHDISQEEDLGPFKENEMLKIGTACYLLAAALREHWVDINKDKYLEQAVEMSYNAFSTKEVITVQLDIIHRMPKGFTSIYTCMEYGLFYLANIKFNSITHLDQLIHSHSIDTGNLRNSCDTGNLRNSIDTRNLHNSNSSGTGYINMNVDELMLSNCFNFMVKSGALPWLYHCLSKWDDIYISKNWNRFIPPSRCAAVFVLHMFLTYLNIDSRKDLIWCRRFCHRVFKMFFDSDVALWYHVFREILSSFLLNVEKQAGRSTNKNDRVAEARRSAELKRMSEMSFLYSLSSSIFNATEAIVNLYHTKLILQYISTNGVELVGLNPKQIQLLLSNIINILIKH
ncbi:uncharacterized protein TA13080 [Theileria annulata]|uniref:Uncharacterized protein n=1 Tax=Theileria annulata TaxID=5874 RepID=Q4UEC4_THEAN|nr:uncharacterized protein TA13080 [Theileria annulata]CAI74565.1 hypothetical protein TA13080 [Theileria annulata]|eukprot:XP_952297.1 hypothetical protein TA13080 [Theileria annulata]